MKAAVLYQLNQPLKIKDLKYSKLHHGQVLVEIVSSGICGTQLLEISGQRGKDPFLPHTLGHEGSGYVIEVGDGVQKVKPGDHVILSWMKGSGIDAAPPSYLTSSNEEINSGPVTTFQTMSIVSENRLTSIPKSMPLIEASLIGCCVATGLGLVFRQANVQNQHTIAVIGLGGIGLNVIQGAAIRQAKKIIAIDIHDHKLKAAQKLGATHIIHANQCNVQSVIDQITQNIGVDFSFECVGSQRTMELAFEIVRRQDGKAFLVGNLPKGNRITIDPFELILGKQIFGSWGGSTNVDQDFPLYVDLFLKGKLKLTELISHRFRLQDIHQAFQILQEGQGLRSIID